MALTDEAIEKIKQMIISGRVRPGEKLPREADLPTARARVWRGMTEPRAQERTLAEHRAIYQAIVNRDPELARSWAVAHIAGIESWLRTALAD